MALYHDVNKLNRSNHAAFQKVHSPGQIVPDSGIYECQGCGAEYACNVGDPFPTQNKHQRDKNQGDIEWLLIVATE